MRKNVTRIAIGVGVVLLALVVIFGCWMSVRGFIGYVSDDDKSNSNGDTTKAGSTADLVNEKVQAQTCVNKNGEYVEVPNEYRQGNGYQIPQKALLQLADGYLVIAEGEWETEGKHDVFIVIYPDGKFGPAVNKDGLHLYEGSLWRYETELASTCTGNFDYVDHLLKVFADDKHHNWESQGMTGNPIDIWLSTGVEHYAAGADIILSDSEQAMANANAEARCPEDDEWPLHENPMGDPNGLTEVVAQIGSRNCRTLLIRGNTATYFTGARDGVHYTPATTDIYLLPDSWGESDIVNWLAANYQNVSLQ